MMLQGQMKIEYKLKCKVKHMQSQVLYGDGTLISIINLQINSKTSYDVPLGTILYVVLHLPKNEQ